MNICLVGGIFDRPEAVRSKQLVTPETVLLDGFREAGVRVHAVGHAGFQPSGTRGLSIPVASHSASTIAEKSAAPYPRGPSDREHLLCGVCRGN